MHVSPNANTARKYDSAVRAVLWSGLGAALIYVLGYLSLRYHLSLLGVDTGLSELDSRYLFSGLQALMYFITTTPLAFVLFLMLLWAARRLRWLFVDRPNGLMVVGIAIATALIQLVMRKCFLLSDMLLRSDQPLTPKWIKVLLCGKESELQTLYFTALLALTFGLAQLWLTASRSTSTPSPLLKWILASLLLVQSLLLPVNFGMLVANHDTPRVATLDGRTALEPDVKAWRIWDSSESVTYFVLRREPDGSCQRWLRTLAKKDISSTEIIRYDPLCDLICDAKRAAQ
jgi:hypothetical protein